ncbi:MAG: NB-ARC domain-containing protein [Elainellaceae cyanobacterium]
MDIDEAIAFTDALVYERAGVHLSDLQQALLRESWSWQRQSYDQIADTYGYSPTYLKHDVGPRLWKLLSEVLAEKVNKKNFRAAIERCWQAEAGRRKQEGEPGEHPPQDAPSPPSPPLPLSPSPQIDWGEAIDVSFFYGRQQELAQLKEWITDDRCRLIAVLGMGGIGKSSLSVKLAQQLQNQFEWVIWRSLRNAPLLSDLLADLLHLWSDQPDPASKEDPVSQGLAYLRSHRCLLIFDNVEAILQSGSAQLSACYRQGYEGYGELFRCVGETVHQSCLVLTSRENPPEITLLAGATLPVRTLKLAGLTPAEGQQIFQLKGSFAGSEQEWQQLIQGYSGNPLALKIIATTISSLFGGNITDFLQQNALVFGNIRSLLEQQFERLSAPARVIMYWLAIYREAATLAELRSDIFPAIAPQQLIEVLDSLEQQSLIEKAAPLLNQKGLPLFSLQPVVMEYVVERFIVQVAESIQADSLSVILHPASLLRSHTLLKAETKDYIREAQVRLILKPVIDRLLLHFIRADHLKAHLLQLLSQLKGKSSLEVGYVGGNLLNLLCQQQSAFCDRDWSHLTLWQADLQQTTLHNVNLANSDLTHSVFAERLGIVFTVAFSPDGQRLATGDAEGGLRLWQVAEGKPLLDLVGHAGWVWSAAFSSNGQQLASCSNDKTVCLWDTQTGQCLHKLQGHSSSIWAVAFAPDGTCVASGGDEPTIRLWDCQTGCCTETLSGHSGRILTLAFHPSGQSLVGGTDDGSLWWWDLQTHTLSQLGRHHNRVWSVTFNPDGSRLASASADRSISLWDTQTQACIRHLSHSDRVRSVAFSSDGKLLVSGSDDKTIRVWEVETGQCLQTLQGHTNSVFSVSLSGDGQTIASGSSDQTVRLWSLQAGRCLKTLKGYTNSIFAVAFRPDAAMLASASTDHTVRLWDVATGSCLKTLTGHQGWVTSVAFHPYQPWLASSSADQTVCLWSTETGQCLKRLQGHSNWVQSVSFSPDGEWLATAGDDQTVRIWSVQTGRTLHVLEGHTGWIWSVAFSPTGERLASSSEDRTVRLWSAQTGECLLTLDDHAGRVQSIAFSPDGSILASASGDEMVRLWSVETGDCLLTLEGHQNNVWSVAFSPDGTTLASGSLDQTIKLWDVKTGTYLRSLSVLTHSVRSAIAFSPVIPPNNPHPILAAGNHNGSISIWDINTGKCLDTLTPSRPYEGTTITNVTGITAAQRAALKTLGAIE